MEKKNVFDGSELGTRAGRVGGAWGMIANTAKSNFDK